MSDGSAEPKHEAQPGMGSVQDHPAWAREIQRRVMLALPRLQSFNSKRRELVRRMLGRPHRIDFFHQVDDPYSYLALQAIAELRERYAVEFGFHLVSQTDLLHAPEPDLLRGYARRDCGWVAPHYGLDFPTNSSSTPPSPQSVARIEAALAAAIEGSDFLDLALATGSALWRDDSKSLDESLATSPARGNNETQRCLEAGNRLRSKRRHYSGAMFWYEGIWYWGVDRLYHLENRLIALGAAVPGETGDEGNASPRFDRPAIDPGNQRDDGRLALEIFPSLRSPYTAVILERSLAVAQQAGIPVTLRPVLPMVMRGVPAPGAKGIYIMLDAKREAETIGKSFGNMFDPIGRAVERGFSLWPFANQRGKGAEFLLAFLRRAFVDGKPTGTDDAIREMLAEVGLSIEEAGAFLDGDAWRAELEINRKAMYDEFGLWGVPSYRLRGPDGEPELSVWGQDRLWLVAAEIRRRLDTSAMEPGHSTQS